MSNNLQISEIDFQTNKAQLIEWMRSQPRFADYDFEGSNLNVLLDILAYNTHLNNFYTNQLFTEMFLDSSQLIESARSHAKHLNYLPRSRRSSKSTTILTFSANDTPASITVPKFQTFTGSGINGATFTFSTTESHIVTSANGIYTVSNVELAEGRVLTEFFDVTADASDNFVLSNKNVDTDSIEVTVYETSNTSSTSDNYVFKSGLFDVNPTDKVFYLEAYGEDQYQIVFGKDQFGLQPSLTNMVQVKYRISSGDAPNGISVFSSASIEGYPVTVSNATPSSGGASQQSLEDIKFFAPKTLQTQERAVTENDFKILLLNEFSEISSVLVYGGEKASPPQFGKVIIVVDVNDQQILTDYQINNYLDFLSTKTVPTVEPKIESAERMYLQISGTVYYEQSETSKSLNQIKSLASNTIITYASTNLNNFVSRFNKSNMLASVDSSEVSIKSSDFVVKPVIEIVPDLNVDFTQELNFSNKLNAFHPIYSGENLLSRDSAVRSSNFTIAGLNCFFVDDGAGTLKIYSKLSDGTFSLVQENVGSVDYDTGTVNISGLNIESFSDTAIEVVAFTENVDIAPSLNRVTKIRSSDLDLSVVDLD